MNYDHLAKLFDAARAAGATTADALRRVDEARRLEWKLSADDVAALRDRRRKGDHIKQLSFDFDISPSYVKILCSGIRRPAPSPKPLPTVADQVLEATRAHFGLTADQLQPHPLQPRWRPSGVVRTARRAASLVLRETGLSYPLIARALGRKDHTTAMEVISAAKTDDDAMAAAAAIAAAVGISMDGAPALERMAA